MHRDVKDLIDAYAQDESVKIGEVENAIDRKLDEIMKEVLDIDGRAED